MYENPRGHGPLPSLPKPMLLCLLAEQLGKQTSKTANCKTFSLNL